MPTTADVARELRGSDFFMGATIYGSGIMWGYLASRNMNLLAQRLAIYHSVSHIFLVLALGSMVVIPYRRLTGYWDNGLRWKTPDDRLKKFDNTSHFEANTIFKHYRIRSDQ